MRTSALMLLAMVAGAGSAAAQERINQTIPSAAAGVVEIHNLAGSVRVTGWNRNEVRITGTLGQGAERLDVSPERDRTTIRVVIPRNGRNIRGSDLEIQVPVRKQVSVTTVSADIEMQNLTGVLGAQSTSGDVEISGSPREVNARSTSGDVIVNATNTTRVQARTTSGDVEVSGSVRESVNAESVSGNVEVTASTPEMRAKSVSGDVSLQRVSGRVTASTVSGDTEIRDSRIQYGSFETVSGTFRFEGDLQRGVAFNIQSHSGDVELALARNAGAEIEAKTFSGDIETEFGGEVRRTSRHGPGRELRFTAGNGDGLVTVTTFSGSVKLLRR